MVRVLVALAGRVDRRRARPRADRGVGFSRVGIAGLALNFVAIPAMTLAQLAGMAAVGVSVVWPDLAVAQRRRRGLGGGGPAWCRPGSSTAARALLAHAAAAVGLDRSCTTPRLTVAMVPHSRARRSASRDGDSLRQR